MGGAYSSETGGNGNGAYEVKANSEMERFPTEDHLMIHRHKHEMTLKFPSIKTDNMLSDQTPTPTRFLKNCEEVGLFNELDCSLEHEFRKAQEEESSKRSEPLKSSVFDVDNEEGKAHSLEEY
ncbi:hypothetical protein CB1_000813020 [Camelus ferus]|nr:hypothetical protein CB1_000813020 [Camelus ferus]